MAWKNKLSAVWRASVVALLCGLLFLQAGCSSYNKAPVESRTGSLKKQTKPPKKLSSSHYRVKRGDTLISISWQAGVEYKTLAAWNGIKAPYNIYSGQVLRLKPLKKSPAKYKSKPAKYKPNRVKMHKVAKKPPRKAAVTKAKPVKKPPKKVYVPNVGKGWVWPASGRIISPFVAGSGTSKGIVIAGKVGQKIIAAEGGKVVYSGNGLIGYGNLVIIKHNNDYLSAYGYNKNIVIKEGQIVKKGQHIADMGRANNGKAGLHFEIRKKGRPVDPVKRLPKR